MTDDATYVCDLIVMNIFNCHKGMINYYIYVAMSTSDIVAKIVL